MTRQLHHGSQVHAGLQELRDECGTKFVQEPTLTFFSLNAGFAGATVEAGLMYASLKGQQEFPVWRVRGSARDQPSLRMSSTVFLELFKKILRDRQVSLFLILHFESILRIRPNPQDSPVEIDAGPGEIDRPRSRSPVINKIS